mgnify:CR=1 FL=1
MQWDLGGRAEEVQARVAKGCSSCTAPTSIACNHQACRTFGSKMERGLGWRMRGQLNTHTQSNTFSGRKRA